MDNVDSNQGWGQAEARSTHEMDHKRYYSDSKKGNVFSPHVSGFKSQTRLNKERAKRTAAVDRKVDRVPGDARGGGGGECQHRLLIISSSVQECYRC